MATRLHVFGLVAGFGCALCLLVGGIGTAIKISQSGTQARSDMEEASEGLAAGFGQLVTLIRAMESEIIRLRAEVERLEEEKRQLKEPAHPVEEYDG